MGKPRMSDQQRLEYHAQRFTTHQDCLVRYCAAVDKWAFETDAETQKESTQELLQHAIHVAAWVGLLKRESLCEGVLDGAVNLLRRMLELIGGRGQFEATPRMTLALNHVDSQCCKELQQNDCPTQWLDLSETLRWLNVSSRSLKGQSSNEISKTNRNNCSSASSSSSISHSSCGGSSHSSGGGSSSSSSSKVLKPFKRNGEGDREVSATSARSEGLRGKRVVLQLDSSEQTAWIVGAGPVEKGKSTVIAVLDGWEVLHLPLTGQGELECKHRFLPTSAVHSHGTWMEEEIKQLEDWGPEVPHENAAAIWYWISCQLGRLPALGATNPCSFKWFALQHGARLGKGHKQHASGVVPLHLAKVLFQLVGEGCSVPFQAVKQHIKDTGEDSKNNLCKAIAPGTKGVLVWEKQACHLLATHKFFRSEKVAVGKRLVYSLSAEGLQAVQGSESGPPPKKQKRER
eukprot:TRINITY_DN24380_c0_g1_i1.p1 TRINITY_DN24380_c0_g1~~TRINITY_DN24380_c0_g1_i1.p1  ORF type:complete len:459 (+),score=70.98 TRINITY_DN24380_c0_g1_i1:62-1438(+)